MQPVRIAVVGPTHPFKGGIAQHTTTLAHRLRDAGHEVEIVSWRRQYPQRLYPGVQVVQSEPELPPFPVTRRRLHWAKPWTWLWEGRRLRHVDLVVIAHVSPVQVPAYQLLAMAGVTRAGTRRGRRVAIVCHNVLPHEPSILERPLVRSLLARGDLVVTHSSPQASLARELTRTPVTDVPLPPFGPLTFTATGERPEKVHRRLLFFGLVRPYKGLDVLLQALAQAPVDLRLRVAGEFWGGTSFYDDLCRDLGISDRVQIIPGYVDAENVPPLFADVDALVLPYRTATGSQGPWTAFDFGLPVIATDAGALADGVTDGVDGLVVRAGDVEALADAICSFYTGDRAQRLRAGVRRTDAAAMWTAYFEALGVPS